MSEEKTGFRVGQTVIGPFITQHVTEVRETIFGPVLIGWIHIDFEGAAREIAGLPQ